MAAALLLGTLLVITGPVLAGTGGAEGPAGSGRDVDHELRAAVRWIFKLDGLVVVKSQRSEDFNEYRVDQSRSSKALMETIREGLAKRKWSVSKKGDQQSEVIKAVRGDKEVTVFLKKNGAEPRLMVEVVEVPKEK